MPARAAPPPPLTEPRPRVGVSSCLLGFEVRYDGRHKRDACVVEELGQLFQWVPVCPEVEAGMGVPREGVRLVRGPGGSSGARARQPTLMLGNTTGADWTDRMNALAHARVAELKNARLAGYIFKSNSPSCGVGRVPLYASAGAGAPAERDGMGLFAAELSAQMPDLPIAEEADLADPERRERFVERVFAHAAAAADRQLTQP